MKTKIVIPLILVLSFFGCKEERKIEIIPDYNKIYLPLNEVDETPQLLTGNEKELIKEINNILASTSDSSEQDHSLDYNFMLNESGTIDKVSILRSDSKKIDNLVLDAIKNWKFKPGVKNGKSVKSQYKWKFYLGSDKAIKPINEGEYLLSVEEMPGIIGGLYSIQKNIKYPETAKRTGIEGKVYVLTYIDEKGNVSDARVIRGIGAGCDEAALNAVKEAKFTPGKHKGKLVKVQVTIPILFKLQ
jgi:TonB family protein